ncbi:MAG TPA: YceI family protein [Streptomyces sp.]|nr:YceI family protein [Streptomyces sp.]
MGDRETFLVVPEQSALLVEARSSAGPITFGTMTLQGRAELAMSGDDLDSAVPISASMEIPVVALDSGNSLYDAELRRRLDARRFPLIRVELHAARSLGGGRFVAEGDLTIHGTTRRLTGTISLALADENTLIATGSELVDIRDFEIELPTLLMLQIFPDVNVQFRLTARRQQADPAL